MKKKLRRAWPAATLAAILLLVAGLYINYRVGLEPVAQAGPEPGRSFVVTPGQNAPAIARALAAASLIRSATAFITYVNFHGLRDKLQAGTYLLQPTWSAADIADTIAAGRTVSKRLLIPPGYTLAKIESAASELGLSNADFAAALAAPHTQSSLASKPAGVSLEGYLYPDTYGVDPSTTAAQLINTMLNNFGRHVGQNYTTAFAAEGLTLHQGLTLASIVQGEIADPTAQPIVAQIFLKRLKLGMPLGSDVTTQYAADLLGVAFSTTIRSAYNTLLAPGLPPGPICSPTTGALDAVAHPATTNYLYFLTDKSGQPHYATTYAQHQANIAKYLN